MTTPTTSPKNRERRPPRERIPQRDVFAWVETNHPELSADAEAERAWVWIATSGPLPKATEDSIAAYGFILSKKGHLLPSGRLGRYGHSCEKPLPFRRKGGGSYPKPGTAPSHTEQQPEKEIDEEALAFLNA